MDNEKNKPTSWFLNELKQSTLAITSKWDKMQVPPPPHDTHAYTCTQSSNLPPALLLDYVSQDYLCSVKNKKFENNF